ncbi:pyridoxal-phosphate-dependent aminotransferase family protein [Acidobacteriota bacterium]
MLKKYHLLSPGPTPLPDEVLMEGARPLIHHRTPEFSRIFMETIEGLKYMFQTKEDVYILTSSGTGAMEAAVVNILSPADTVICINGGKFGGRWSHICQAYGVEVYEITLEWGEILTKEQLADALRNTPDCKAVFTTLCETSTGAVFDIKGYGEILCQTDSILVVDAISGLGATACPMDEWQIDVLISASQKSFMTPPGLAYMSFSQKSWKAVKESTLPRFYFDARMARKSFLKQTSPWTPGTSLIFQQAKALEFIRQFGLEQLIEHHKILGEATRAGILAIELNLLSRVHGNVLTSVLMPDGIDGVQFVKLMHEKYGAYVAGAQDPHKGEFFRIAHLGYMSGFEVITALSAVEMALSDMGHDIKRGTAVAAAENILKENML